MFRMIPGVMLLSVCVPHPVVVQSTEPAAPTTTCAGFNRAVEQYLGTRRRLLREVPDLRVTEDSAEIAKRSDALALAIQRARSTAQQGDFFDSACRHVITERLSRALTGAEAAQLLITINDEPTLKRRPRVHMRYPVASSMATIPTKLLDLLPPLPPELEYRFLGRSLVLRDRNAALLLDYVMQAIPTR
jgi:hypothetical protein